MRKTAIFKHLLSHIGFVRKIPFINIINFLLENFIIVFILDICLIFSDLSVCLRTFSCSSLACSFRGICINTWHDHV